MAPIPTALDSTPSNSPPLAVNRAESPSFGHKNVSPLVLLALLFLVDLLLSLYLLASWVRRSRVRISSIFAFLHNKKSLRRKGIESHDSALELCCRGLAHSLSPLDLPSTPPLASDFTLVSEPESPISFTFFQEEQDLADPIGLCRSPSYWSIRSIPLVPVKEVSPIGSLEVGVVPYIIVEKCESPRAVFRSDAPPSPAVAAPHRAEIQYDAEALRKLCQLSALATEPTSDLGYTAPSSTRSDSQTSLSTVRSFAR